MADVRAFDVHDVPLVPVAVRCFLQGGNAADVVNAFVSAFSRPADATSTLGQNAFAEMLEHPIARAYPLRSGYTIAVAKAYIKLCEAAFEAQQHHDVDGVPAAMPPPRVGHDGGEQEDEPPCAVSETLVEWFAHAQSCASTVVMVRHNPLSFRSFSVGHPAAAAAAAAVSNAASLHDSSDGTNTAAPLPLDEPKHWVHVAVGSQFTNVGLSLWPSAYILLQVLQSALCDCTDPIAQSAIACPSGLFQQQRCTTAGRRIRLVELGAGVGLTSVVFQRWLQLGWLRKGTHVDMVLTDYQEGILENALRNVRAAAVDPPGDADASAPPPPLVVERGAAAVETRTALLDWTDARRVKEPLFEEWDADVILAADCIYDVDVIDGLLHTIHIGLEVAARRRLRRKNDERRAQQPAADDEAEDDAPFALVVQTHRQHSTMQRFFVGASKFGTISSWTLSAARPSGGSSNQQPGEYVLEKMPSALWLHEGDNESRCNLKPWLVGPFLVDMPGIVCVHKITLNKQRATSSPPPLPPSAMQP